MAKRSYHQYCGLAAALDLLGERWSMLILRDLLAGPKRFTDLLEGLPGIGTGLLSQRLRELETARVIEKATLPPPAASTVYQLTADGQRLREPLLGLARWGLDRLGPPDPQQRIDAEPLALAIAARYEPSATENADGTYGLVIDGKPFELLIGHDGVQVRSRTVENARVVITTDTATLIEMNSGETTLTAALEEGTVTVDGDLTAVGPLAASFGF
ncbi:hypothetical protein BVU76_03955 [Mycolicibacterium porcinum]|nr:hypothetical protein BVU76_03955 [Mycolicibacterium porcinum]